MTATLTPAVIAQVRAVIARWNAECAALDPREARSERERDERYAEQARLTRLVGDTQSALHELDPAKGKAIRFVLSLETYLAHATTWRKTLCDRLLAASGRRSPTDDADVIDLRLGISALDRGSSPIGRALTALMQVDYPPTWGGPADVWEATGADAHGHAHGAIPDAQARLDELKPRVDAARRVIEDALCEAAVPAPAT